MNLSSDEWKSALMAVLSRAMTDADFRAKCLSDPVAAVRDAVGIALPDGIRFTEDTGDEGAVYLPPLGNDPDEITDSELLNLAGGQVIPTVTDCFGGN